MGRWGGGRLGAALLVIALAALLGCAPATVRGGVGGELPDAAPAISRRAAAPYAATLRVLLRAGNREASFRAGCAVDPDRGVRIEVRDPLGATRLLLLLGNSGGALLVDPARGVESAWDASSEALPWVPDALRAFLVGTAPPGTGGASGRGGDLRFAWPAGGGTVKAELMALTGGPAPFSEGEFKGPGRTRLRLVLSGAQPGELRPEALLRPPMDLETTDLWDLLQGGAP